MAAFPKVKFATLLLATSFSLGCTDLGSLFNLSLPKNPSPSSATPAPTPTPTATPQAEPKKTALTLTMKEGAAANPVGPEDLESVVVDGVTIDASQIVFETSAFAVQADTNSDYQVVYEGAGKYYILNKSTGTVLQNRALIVFNLANAKGTMAVPILKGILEDKIKMTIDLSTGNIFGGVTKADGTIDDTQPVFKIGTDGKMVVTEPSGQQTTFSRNDATSTHLPDPDEVVELTPDEVAVQVSGVTSAVSATSPIADYVGLWLWKGLGQQIIVTAKDAGANTFEASATLGGTEYSGTGSYDPTGSNDTLTLNVAKDNTVVEVAKVGNNAMTFTLKATDNTKAQVFKGTTLNLQRVRVID